MNIKVELLKNYISDFLNNNLEDFEIDASKIADTTAVQALSEIQKVIKNESYSDFEAKEEIVGIFEKYNIDFGNCHEFLNKKILSCDRVFKFELVTFSSERSFKVLKIEEFARKSWNET